MTLKRRIDRLERIDSPYYADVSEIPSRVLEVHGRKQTKLICFGTSIRLRRLHPKATVYAEWPKSLWKNTHQEPSERRAISEACAGQSDVGHFASVAVASADDAFDPTGAIPATPLWRGHGMVVRFGGLVKPS